jgi:FKBP-type peptidyl-prolyl cis-trans isomerase 2
MKIGTNSLVEIKYNAHGKSLTTSDKSYNISDCLRFRIGSGKIHRKFEKKLIGMEKDEEKEFDLVLKNVDQNLIIWKKKSDFTFDGTPSKGKEIELVLDDGKNVIGTILAVKEKQIMIDLNSPLAGKIIHFKVKVLNILS